MSTQVLTDDFIDEAQVRFARSTTKELARYIEQAVIERMDKKIVNRWGAPCRTEAECRERERKAWDAAITGGVDSWMCNFGSPQSRRDELYPPLLPKPPREVVGPSGTRYRKVDGKVERWYGSPHCLSGWSPIAELVVEDVPTVARLMEDK